jgi:plasmid replication initiation protein
MSHIQLSKKDFHKRIDNYQPNSLTLSRQEWGLNDRKVLAFVINQMDHDTDYSNIHGMTFQIPIQEISKHMDYRYIKKSMLNLQEKRIIFLDESLQGKESFESIVLFPIVSYNKNNSKLIEVTVMQQGLLFLANLGKQYTRYNLDAFLRLSTVHSQRIYELIMMETRRANGKKNFNIMIDELQELLGCNYENFAHFKRRVLDPAQKDIFEKADIVFEYETSKKEGKKVVEIKFKIQTYLDIAYQNVVEELNYYNQAESQHVFIIARNLLEQQYTFKPEQIDRILNQKELLDKFVEINAKIDNGILKIKTSKTSYMAKSLGLSIKQKH